MRFRQKMVLVMVWLLTLSYGVGGVLLIRQNFQSSLTQIETNAKESYEMILKSIQLVNFVDIQQDLSNISNTLETMNTSESLAGMSLKRGDKVLYQSGETIEEVESSSAFISLLFTRENRHLYQISGEIKTNGKPLVLTVVYDITSVYQARDDQIKTYHQVLAVLLLVGGIAAWFTAYLMTKPLVNVSKTARALSNGNLDARVNPKTHDEIGQLGSDFDNMAERLSDNISELKNSMEHQEMFMGSFAHELKTPMTSIIGYADLLRSDALGPEESQEAANYIFSEGKRLEALSFKLLDLLMMRNQKLKMVPTDMKHMVENLTYHLQPVYRKKGIALQCRCEPGICMAEPDLFGSVIANLVDNSRKAMDHGGNIMIMGDSYNGDYRIRVIDNGRGMPEEAIRHITEAFYRVDKSRSRAQGGAGLGLTLCKEIIDLHNGKIAFASREGNGTCVTVTIKEITA
ncbi:MAG: HAMP domain-containing histidine kinase [Clostridiales bacterium]|nr:HAMP domain-containing histidine kinase [Clostridiales bacterium]